MKDKNAARQFDEGKARARIRERAERREAPPMHELYRQALAARLADWRKLPGAQLHLDVFLNPVWYKPRDFWQRVWPNLKKKNAGWVVFVPWGVLLAGYCLWLVLDLINHLPAQAPAMPTDAETLGFISTTDLLTGFGSPSAWLADLWTPPWLPGIWGLSGLYHVVIAYGALVGAAAALLAPLHVLTAGQEPAEKETSHGTAIWGTIEHALKAKVLLPKGDNRGVLVGRLEPEERADPAILDKLDLRYRAPYHTMFFAPNRSGKLVSGIATNLLNYEGSVFVVDPKGELCEVTKRRRMEMGQAVACIAPFGLLSDGPCHSINLLDPIDPKLPSSISDAMDLANMIVVRSKGDDGHFDEAAAQLLQGLILYVACLKEDDADRHLGLVWEIVSGGAEEFAETLALMAACQHQGSDGKSSPGAQVVAGAANSLLNKDPKERASVLSTVVRHTHFLSDPRIVETLKTSSFNLRDLKRDKLSVFVVIPPEYLHNYSRYVRAILGSAINAMLREKTIPSQPVLFVLDEFYQLGRCDPVARNISIAAGLGAIFMLVLQDVGQLKSLYDTWESFISSCTAVFFRVADVTTAEYIAKRLGKKTIRVKSHGESESRGGRNQNTPTHGKSESETATGRSLLDPSEVMNMQSEQALVFSAGMPPFRVQRLNYLSDPEYVGQFDDNPLYSQAAA